MRWYGVVGVLLLSGCQRAPAWLAEAPLVGVRIRDDAGRELYLKRPPARVALAAPEAVALWQQGGLFAQVVAACAGSGENTRIFYLPCDDSVALADAVFRAQADWVWVSRENSLDRSLSLPSYTFAPKSTLQWLNHLRTLAEVYDLPPLRVYADSVAAVVKARSAEAQQSRRLRVLVVVEGQPIAFLTQDHPLATLVREAGGEIPYAKADAAGLIPADTLRHNPPEVLLVSAEAPQLVNDFLTLYPEAYSFPAVRYRRIFSVERWMVQMPFAEPVRAFSTLLGILHPEIGGSAPQSANQVENSTQEETQD